MSTGTRMRPMRWCRLMLGLIGAVVLSPAPVSAQAAKVADLVGTWEGELQPWNLRSFEPRIGERALWDIGFSQLIVWPDGVYAMWLRPYHPPSKRLDNQHYERFGGSWGWATWGRLKWAGDTLWLENTQGTPEADLSGRLDPIRAAKAYVPVPPDSLAPVPADRNGAATANGRRLRVPYRATLANGRLSLFRLDSLAKDWQTAPVVVYGRTRSYTNWFDE